MLYNVFYPIIGFRRTIESPDGGDVVIGWLVRILLLAGGVVAGWFVPRDELGYTIIQFVVVLLIILAASVATLYLPALRRWRRDATDKPK